MSRRILITGGAGFIGGHIAERLAARGDRVVALDDLSTGSRANLSPDVEFVQGDVRDADVLAGICGSGVDAVLHIAGQASIRLSYASPGNDLSVNTIGTLSVLDACVRFGIPRLLFASSMTLYGRAETVPTPETAPPDPVSFYAITKYAAERYVHLTAARPDLSAPLHATSFRMFNVYGERQSLTNAYQGVLAIFIGRVLRGEPILIHGDGEQSRDFVHIDDIARAWIDAIDQPSTNGQVINLGTGIPTTVNQLCDLVLESFGHTRATYPVEYHPAQPGDMRRSAADIRRAHDLLGWSPRVDRAEGMQRTIAWAKNVMRGG
jgi:UDP-glucose 4-epimerase